MDAILEIYANVAGGLVVYPKMIARNIDSNLPFMATENILMEAVKRGGDRQALHERIRVHAQAAASRMKGRTAWTTIYCSASRTMRPLA